MSATHTTYRGRTVGKRLKAEPFRIDREAVRAVVSHDGFQELEQIQVECFLGHQDKASFWRTVREEMVRTAQELPEPAVKIVPAKVGAVGAMLGLSSSEIAKLVQQVDVPGVVAAAAANLSIQEFQRGLQYRDLWTKEAIRRNPPMRVEFDHAIVFGSISDAGDIAKGKSWGRLIRIEPLQPEDRLFPRNITYFLKPSSKLRMRWEVRDTFKHVLRDRRCLVSEAVRCTKKSFLEYLSAVDAKIIGDRLHLTPDRFWQMAKRGERWFGPDGIASFVRTLEEKTKGCFLPFPEERALVQIRLTSPLPPSQPHSDSRF